MVKKHYIKELQIANTQQINGEANNRREVMKIQSWLVLSELAYPGSSATIAIDGDFGPATLQAVKKFQQHHGLPAEGKVDQKVFDRLCLPMKNAFENPVSGQDLRELVVKVANQHLSFHPFELMINNESNCGPWVRAYMDGFEGKMWWWCMGFVQTIIDQAASLLHKNFRILMPQTYSCDTVGMYALNQHNLVRNKDFLDNPSKVKPGDIFLIRKTSYDWIHTGIIVNVGDGIFETIEGNTNREGSANGNRVFRRIRNYRKARIDVVSLDPLL